MSVFFFKQKTAYEMRIRDWSSDVCSSDLLASREPDHMVRRVEWHRLYRQRRDPGRRARGIAELLTLEPDDRDGGLTGELPRRDHRPQIGRASCRECVCPYA